MGMAQCSFWSGSASSWSPLSSWDGRRHSCFYRSLAAYYASFYSKSKARIPDRVVWHYESSGEFSVKSAYHLAFSLQQPVQKKHGVSFLDQGLWKWVWTRSLPPKLLFFLWQCLLRILPTREALAARGVDLIPICPVCGRKEETIEHLFFQCVVARRLWTLIGMRQHLLVWEKRSFVGFVRHSLRPATGEDPDYFTLQIVCLLWRLWKNRCSTHFEHKQLLLPTLAAQWQHQVKEVDMAILQPRRAASAIPFSSSSAGPRSRCHAMFDAAVKTGSAGVAAFVLFDDSGGLQVAKAQHYAGIEDPYILESLALRDCLQECVRRQLRNVVVGGDAKVVIDKCRHRDTSDGKIGAILQEILSLLGDLGNSQVLFIGRNFNRVAHSVARRALSLSPSFQRGFDYVAWYNSR
ncbi:unnamed protein product [Linum tenue]|uniref:Reverse transcriptase zinc-binding domain-containing protein n=1 Tax=Linum tenue TaxID=586396 RepID=A0AAV0S9N9_9ROSI|nr:unnamed protein product [Linum tenue]